MKFIFISGVTIPRRISEDDNVFLHLSFDDYAPDYMEPEGPGVYFSLRMVPPGPLNYFYSIEGTVYQEEGKKSMRMSEPITTVRHTNNT
jgi:hypothetical protein